MKVDSIDRTHFNGRFRNNALLKKVLEDAEPYDLENFLVLLNSMEKVNDFKNFSLRIVSQPLLGGDFMALCENEQKIGHRYLQLWDKNTEKIWRSVLGNINGMLNNRYPAPNIKAETPKEQLLKDIYNKLNVNA